ncbi:MAG: hypothetical protein KY463_01060 [Actinobacteria bacterium]|nr:hypothetical protein [Actinomycetota bacterium]
MPLIAAAVLIACVAFAAVIWHRRQGRERTADFDEALGRVREELQEVQWRRAVIPGAIVVALVLLATLARNPSRWALLLVALGALAAGVIAFVVSERRRRRDTG